MTGSAGSVYTCATATTETGVWIASGGVDHIVRVWEPPDLAAAGALLWADDSTAAVSAVATAPAADGCLIAAGDEAGASGCGGFPEPHPTTRASGGDARSAPTPAG